MERGDAGKDENPTPKQTSKSRLHDGDSNTFKMPWVPAPGKATTISNLPIPNASPGNTSRASKSTSYASQTKAFASKCIPRSRASNNSAGKRCYTLKSKDSLVDVVSEKIHAKNSKAINDIFF